MNNNIFKNEDEARRFWDSGTKVIITNNEREVLEYITTSSLSRYLSKDSVCVIIGYDHSKFTDENIVRYESLVGPTKWHSFWQNYIALQVGKKFSTDIMRMVSNPGFDMVLLLSGKVLSLESMNSIGLLAELSNMLRERGESVQIAFSGLDANSKEDDNSLLRKRALDGLLFFWLENRLLLPNITPKIIMTENTWKSLSFENKGHYYWQSMMRLS